MSNGFPYFQFCCDRWLTGKINAFNLDEQGLFLHFCMRAWVGNGAFGICSTLVQRQFNKTAEWMTETIASFLDCGILAQDGDQYRIKFIDAQLFELGIVREKRSAAGKASAEARRNSINTEKSKKRREEKRRVGCSTLVNKCSTPVERTTIFSTMIGDFPDLAKKPEIQQALESWLQHRKSKKAPVTDRVARVVLSRLSERPTDAVAALDTCMVAGWTDVRWDWIDNRNAKQAPAPIPGNRFNRVAPIEFPDDHLAPTDEELDREIEIRKKNGTWKP